MMRRALFYLSMSLVLLALATLAPAQRKKPKSTAVQYKMATEVRITGIVLARKDYFCPVTGEVGAHLLFATPNNETIEVHVAPLNFLRDYNIKLEDGDRLEILGSQIEYNGAPALLAREIKRETWVYTFRDPAGQPLW